MTELSAPDSQRRSAITLLRALLIAVASVWIYSPAFHGDWIWDDNLYIVSHLHLHDPANLWKTWLAPGTLEDYYPLESAVLLVQWHLWHEHTLGYHLTNVFLHITSALLIWRLLDKIGLRPAWLAGLIFALHPLMVESVAWMVELKNTLSLPPLVLAMCAYVDYEDSRRNRDYFLALGLFLIAMLCKAAVMMFPVIILLYLWWKRGRIDWNDLKSSAPFFAISLFFGILTARLQHEAVIPGAIEVGWASRFATVGWEMVFCFSKVFFPGILVPIYPHRLVVSPSLFDLVPWLMLIGALVFLWSRREGWGRHALLGLGFFLLNLVPVFAFSLINAAKMVWSMDHLIYLPSIGLIGLGAAAWGLIMDRLSRNLRVFCVALTALTMTALACESHAYAKIFSREEIFWNYTLRYNPMSPVAHNDLGALFLHTGHLPQALEHFKASLRLEPNDPEVHYNFGNALDQAGQVSQAMEQYEEALRLNPELAEAYYSLGNDLVQNGKLTEASAQYQQAIRINPDYADAHTNLGNALLQLGHIPQAVEQYEHALDITPDDIDVRTILGQVLLQTGQISQAAAQFEAILQIDPRNAGAQAALAKIRGMTKAAPPPSK